MEPQSLGCELTSCVNFVPATVTRELHLLSYSETLVISPFFPQNRRVLVHEQSYLEWFCLTCTWCGVWGAWKDPELGLDNRLLVGGAPILSLALRTSGLNGKQLITVQDKFGILWQSWTFLNSWNLNLFSCRLIFNKFFQSWLAYLGLDPVWWLVGEITEDPLGVEEGGLADQCCGPD